MPPSTNRDRLLWVAGAAALAVLFDQTLARADRPGGIDLTTYLEAARAVQRGENPYTLPLAFPYIYPPFLAFALIPLAALPGDAALAIWVAASAAAIVWALRSTLLSAYPELGRRPLTPFLAALFAVAFPVLQSNVRNGQVNFLVIALAVGALAAGPAVPRGVCWALAIVVKIVPAALAPFFVRRREWAVCAAAAASLAALCVMPALTMGARVAPMAREYATSFLAGSFGAAADATLDFSLGGMLAWAYGADGPGVRLLGLALPVGLAFAVDLRTTDDRRARACAFALYLTVIPLASPKSEVHHLAFALPGAALAFATAWFRIDRRPSLTLALAVALAAHVLALALPAWRNPLWFVSVSALACALGVLCTRDAPSDTRDQESHAS
jgi:alpha-1,2-mannosyltransferase